MAPSLGEIEVLAADAYARLPEHFRGLCANLIIQVADFPTEEVLEVMNVETEFKVLVCRFSRPVFQNSYPT